MSSTRYRVEDRTGVIATTDRAAVFGLNADCVLYMPRATGAPQTRAGLTIPEILDDVVTMLQAGANIVTTCTGFIAGGNPRLGDEGIARIRAACERGHSSLFATGSVPGLVSEQIAFALLAAQRRVESVEIAEFGDLSHRPSPHMVFDQMGFGKPLAEFAPDQWAAHLHGEYAPALRMLAEAAGFTVDESAGWGEVAAARRDTSIIAGEIRRGLSRPSASSSPCAAPASTSCGSTSTPTSPRTWTRSGTCAAPGGGCAVTATLRSTPISSSRSRPRRSDRSLRLQRELAGERHPVRLRRTPGILTTEDLPPILPRGPRPDK